MAWAPGSGFTAAPGADDMQTRHKPGRRMDALDASRGALPTLQAEYSSGGRKALFLSTVV